MLDWQGGRRRGGGGGGANPAVIWGRGQSCCYLGEGPGSGVLVNAAMTVPSMAGILFMSCMYLHLYKLLPTCGCCHGNHGVLPQLSTVMYDCLKCGCVGTILPASRPGGQAWYLPRVPVQWTLQVNMKQVCVVMCVPVSVHSAMCVCLPVHIVYLFYLTLLLPTQYTGLPPPQTIYQGSSWKASSLIGHHTEI